MSQTLEQNIKVRIDTYINGLPAVQAFSKSVEKLNSTPTKKLSFADPAAATNTDKLASSVDRLATAVDRLDGDASGKLGRFLTVIGGIATILGHLKGAQEGIGVIKDLAGAAPNVAAKVSGAGATISGFFSLAKEKIAGAASAVKTKVAGIAEDLPAMVKGLAGGTAGLLGIGAAGTIAAGGLLAAVGAIAGIIAIVVALPAISALFLHLAGSTAEAGSKFHDLSQETGVSVELLSSLAPVLEDSNSSVEEFAGGMSKLNKLIGEGAAGSKEATANLLEFGIKPKEALLDQEAALEKVIKRVLELPPGIQQSIAMQKAFGKSGDDLLPTLIATGGNIKAVKEEAQRLGKYWTTEGAAAADEYGDKINEVKRIVGGLAETVGRNLLPELLRLLRIFAHEMPRAGGAFASVLSLIGSLARGAANQIIFLAAAAQTLRDIPAAIADVATGKPVPALARLNESFSSNLAALHSIGNTATPSAAPGTKALSFPGSGGGGGGSKRKSKPEDTFEAVFGFNKAAAESALKLLQDSLDRQLKAVEESFEQRKLSIRDYYEELERLQRQDLNLQIDFAKQAVVNEGDRLAHNIANINKDADLDAAEKTAKIKIETKNTESAIVALNEKLVTLIRKRGVLAGELAEKEVTARRALEDQFQSVIDEIDRDKGLGPLVDARARISELNRLIEEVRQNSQAVIDDLIARVTAEGMVSPDESVLQTIRDQRDALIEILELRQESIATAGRLYSRIEQGQRAQELNEARINTIREEGSRNVVTQFMAEQRVNAIRRQQIADAQALLQELIRVAGATTDPTTLLAIEKQRAAVAGIKNEYRSLGQTIKDTFLDAAAGGIEDFLLSFDEIIAGTKTLADAFRAMGLSIIEELQKIIAKMIALKIISFALSLFGGGGAGQSLSAGMTGGFAGGAATGGEFSAHPGGRLIQVAEAGHDELVVSTDPRYARRTAGLLGRFIKRTGILPDLSQFNSSAILGNISARIPSFGAGDFVPATAGAQFAPASGDTFDFRGMQLVLPNVRDARDFKTNSQAILRDAGRAIAGSIKNGRGTRE